MSEQSIRCAFCSDDLPSSTAMHEHLHMCGNKTEQCPNCRKYIRRAIFAYHYENNCADLDLTDEEASPVRTPSNPSSTHSPFEPRPERVIPNTGEKEQLSRTRIYLPIDHAPTNRAPRACETVIVCSRCREEYDPAARDHHQIDCTGRTNHVLGREQPSSARKYEAHQQDYRRTAPAGIASGTVLVDKSHDNDFVPCEFCDEPIELQNYHDHTNSCLKRDQERQFDYSRNTEHGIPGNRHYQNLDSTWHYPEVYQRHESGFLRTDPWHYCTEIIYRLPPLYSTFPRPF